MLPKLIRLLLRLKSFQVTQLIGIFLLMNKDQNTFYPWLEKHGIKNDASMTCAAHMATIVKNFLDAKPGVYLSIPDHNILCNGNIANVVNGLEDREDRNWEYILTDMNWDYRQCTDRDIDDENIKITQVCYNHQHNDELTKNISDACHGWLIGEDY